MHWRLRDVWGGGSQDEERQTRIGSIVLLDFGLAGCATLVRLAYPGKFGGGDLQEGGRAEGANGGARRGTRIPAATPS